MKDSKFPINRPSPLQSIHSHNFSSKTSSDTFQLGPQRSTGKSQGRSSSRKQRHISNSNRLFEQAHIVKGQTYLSPQSSQLSVISSSPTKKNSNRGSNINRMGIKKEVQINIGAESELSKLIEKGAEIGANWSSEISELRETSVTEGSVNEEELRQILTELKN